MKELALESVMLRIGMQEIPVGLIFICLNIIGTKKQKINIFVMYIHILYKNCYNTTILQAKRIKYEF